MENRLKKNEGGLSALLHSMKIVREILMFGFLIFSPFRVFSQNELAVTYNSTHSGRNIAFTYSKTFFEKHEFGGGLKYNINRFAHSDDQMNVFYKRLYATEPIHHLGAEFFYNWHFSNNWHCVRPFLFYDSGFAYSTTMNRMYLPIAYDEEGAVLYRKYLEYFGPFTWVEQSLGIGFKANVYSSIYLIQRVGFSGNFMIGYDKKIPFRNYRKFEFEFGFLLSFGLAYRF